MFVAVNYITVIEEYKERFETLFATRAKAIDRMPGFRNMEVMKNVDGKGQYLIVSHWDSADQFKKWTTSPEFIDGHQRGFEDIANAKKQGREAPMKSDFITYEVISR